jgi:alpha/beta superfamily hydrolase
VPRLIQSPAITGISETLLEEPEPGPPRLAVLVCHPHPLHGGTMHNKVVYRIARAMRHSGAVVLRFNFRKTGVVEEGVDDARAALEWLRGAYPALPYALAGFSFGARVATVLACELPDLQFVLAAGFPTRWGRPEYLHACEVPKIFVQSTNDQYGPRGEFEVMYREIAEPKEVRWVEAADHFFAGALDEFEQNAGQTSRPAL